MKWLIPLKIGIPLGVILGVQSAMTTIAPNRYLQYHLYNTAAQVMVPEINRYLVPAIGVAIIIAIGLLIYFRFTREKEQPQKQGAETAVKTRGFEESWIVNGIVLLFLILALFANVSAAVLRSNAASEVRKKPNIIFIMVDTLRADHLGCFGYSRNTSPNIDQLASDSIFFNRAIAQAPWTTWSVGSLLTSRYPEIVGAGSVSRGNEIFCDDYWVTMAKALKNQGYSTGAVISNFQAGREVGLSEGYDFFDESSAREDVTSPSVCSSAKDIIDRWKSRRFFLFMLFRDPHWPYISHPEFGFTSKDKAAMPTPMDLPGVADQPISPSSVNSALDCYDSDIKFTDEYVGMVLEDLKRQGLYDNSLIVFFGDHGEEFMDHGGVFHGDTLYNEALHVPLFIKLPRQDRKVVVTGTFPLINVFPSVMRAINSDYSHMGLDGTGEDLTHPREIQGGDAFSATHGMMATLFSMESGRYKYIINVDKPEEMLFDVVADESEKHDLSKEQPAIARAMRKIVLARSSNSAGRGTPAGMRGNGMFTEAEKARLRSLGYMQ